MTIKLKQLLHTANENTLQTHDLDGENDQGLAVAGYGLTDGGVWVPQKVNDDGDTRVQNTGNIVSKKYGEDLTLAAGSSQRFEVEMVSKEYNIQIRADKSPSNGNIILTEYERIFDDYSGLVEARDRIEDNNKTITTEIFTNLTKYLEFDIENTGDEDITIELIRYNFYI